MGLGNFFDNFMGGLAFGMLANNPFFSGMGCYGYGFGGGRMTEIIDFGTFANPFPNPFGNMNLTQTSQPISILSDFANPAYPQLDFSQVGKTIWDNVMDPDSEFNKRMREYYNNQNNTQQTYNYKTIQGYDMPFSQWYLPTQFNLDGYYPQAQAVTVSNPNDTSVKPKATTLEPDATDAEEARKVTTSVTTTTNTANLSRLKGKRWFEMSDDEMRQVYGNYSKDITEPYNGTEAQLNKYLKGKGVLQGKAAVFLEAQKRYGINAAVLAAITVHESGNGKSNVARNKNNVGGVRISGSTTFRTFANVDECIMHMAKLLKNSYVDNPPEKRGAHLTKLYQINARYCPTADPTDRTNENAGWARIVSNNVSAIENIA